jgi:hypothetical protein
MMRRRFLQRPLRSVAWATPRRDVTTDKQDFTTGNIPPQSQPLPPADGDAAKLTDETAFEQLARLATDSSGTPEYVAPRGANAALAAAAGVTGSGRGSLYREALSSMDPLGGMMVEDYYRDPAAGYTPQYAPRDFGAGGALSYSHPLSSFEAERAAYEREATTHSVERYSAGVQGVRGTLRGAGAAGAASSYLDSQTEAHSYRLTAGLRRPGDSDIGATFRDLTVPREADSAVASWHDMAGGAASDEANSFASRTSVARDGVDRRVGDQGFNHDDHVVTELFARAHGLRDRDAFEEDRATRNKMPWSGYDPSLPNGRTNLPLDLPVLTSPASMAEAQQAVRSNGTAQDVQVASRVLAQNTNDQQPAIGAALTERVAQAVSATERLRVREREDAFRDRHGFGRQAPLVADGGPDKRRLELHKNDERILRASQFAALEYADSVHGSDAASNIEEGVGRLIRNKFDLDRRAALLGRNRQDPLERSQVFYGVPTKQRTDHIVRFGTNRRFERHLEYFKPHPTLEDMQLHRVHDDTAGFPLLRGRNVDTYEFELFARYRAHHQQRRLVALAHGLEPKPNETATERDARRKQLDALCEATPFDDSRMSAATGTTAKPTVNVLRQWFGAYWLPSPTLVSQTLGTELQVGAVLTEDRSRSDLRMDESGVATPLVDTREHLLSGRYVNRLLTIEALNTRLLRGYIKENLRHAPETQIRFRQQHHITKHFTRQQQRMYDEYVASETERHLEAYTRIFKKRRYIADRGAYASPENFFTSDVVVVRSVENGEEMCVLPATYDTAVAASTAPDNSKGQGAIVIDGKEVVVVPDPDSKDGSVVRRFSFVEIKIDGATSNVIVTEDEWNLYPEEEVPVDPNAHITNGMIPHHYNRANYIETQDSIWEARTSSGEEGWTPALATDEFAEGTPVLASRLQQGGSFAQTCEPERAVVTTYQNQPFFNPKPKRISVRFLSDGTVAEVPLRGVMIWQALRDGPRRNVPLETRIAPHNTQRYVDFGDPKGRTEQKGPHFLDKYRGSSRADRAAEKLDRMRNIRDVDTFNELDFSRGENHRLISATHRRDYMSSKYFHRYTPWEYIAHQEANAPYLTANLRRDNVGPVYFHSANRFWLTKRRATGYVRNHDGEVRDFLQYVDGITPWAKAKKIRAQWEVRMHHPVPHVNRPNLAVHRNNEGMLPSNLLDVSKRDGRVMALKDTLREYRPAALAPAWSEL